MNTLSKLWRGEYSLAKTYWLFGVVANIVLSIPLNLYYMVTPESQVAYVYYYIGFLVLYSSYNFIAAVGLWRSASAYTSNILWKYLAKLMAVIGIFSPIATTLYIANSLIATNNEATFSRYVCTNYYAQNEVDCNRTLNGTTKFTIDKNHNEVFTTNTNLNGPPVISKLQKCVIINTRNWRCGGETSIDNFPNGNMAVTQDQGTQMVDGVISTINYNRVLSNGAKIIQETKVLSPLYK